MPAKLIAILGALIRAKPPNPDTADWGIAIRAGRWYLSIIYWGINKVLGNMWQICLYQAQQAQEAGSECRWTEYATHRDGRYRWQMELAQALCRAGCESACAELEGEEAKPPWMPATLVPCGCETCMFCDTVKTNGMHFAVRSV